MRGSAAFRVAVAPGGALAGPWVKNSLWTRARAVPSLDLCFADTKSLVCATTGQNLVTFTRASSATFVDSSGVLRSAVTNLLLRSEELDNASWQKNAVTVSANVAINPSGIQTADKIEETAVTNFFAVIQNPTGAFSTTYTWSCYAKASERNFLALNFSVSGLAGTWNLTTGVNNITGGTATAVFVGNGWWRLSATFATPASGSNVLYHIFGPSINNTINTYAGTAGSGIYLWGAQLEQSATVGEYIPTTSAINSAPRFDHNPTTGESLGLLVEEARTNLVLNSESYELNTLSDVTVTANDTIAPNGAATADRLVETATTASHFTQATHTSVSGTIYTYSVYLKNANRNFALATVNGTGTLHGISVNLTTGAVASAIGTPSNITTTTLANGWFRVAFTYTSGTSGSVAGEVRLSTDGVWANRSYAGNVSFSLFAWGAQLEAGAFATSYIPTTTATVTRAADVASITGSNFSSWYNQTEGTVFAEANSPTSGTDVSFDDGTVNTNRVVLYYQAVTDPRLFVASAGATSCIISAGTITSNSRARLVGAYKLNDFAASVNGASPALDASGDAPTGIDRARIGRSSADGGYLNGCLRRLTYWPVRLQNLQAITQP